MASGQPAPPSGNSAALTQLLIERIDAIGPIRFSEYVAEALYNPDFGFYATGGRAGRRGDFITSAEVGPLFGLCIGRYLDKVWSELGQPSEFVVIEAGAGPGTLARSVLAGAPACLPALRYMAVEISAGQRELHPQGIESVAALPADGAVHVVLANELLDNLPFDIVERTADGWSEVHVDAVDGALVETLLGNKNSSALFPSTSPLGARVPVIDAAREWCDQVVDRVDSGRVLVLDYASPTSVIVEEPEGNWVRTYRANERGVDPLLAAGSQDITTQIPVEQLRSVAGHLLTVRSQAELLGDLGIDELVAEGKTIWAERAHLGDLEAMKARSRVSEAETLLDPDGLGGFIAFEWRVPK